MIQTLINWDRILFYRLNGFVWPGWLDRFFVLITEDDTLIARLFLIAVWIFLMTRGPYWRKRALWLIPLIALSDSMTSHFLKDLFGRLRPCHREIASLRLLVDCGPSPSFPSSHAANMGAAGFFLALGFRTWGKRALVMIFPLLVAYSRIHVGVHYPLDVMVGVIEGMFLGWLLNYFLGKLPSEWESRISDRET